MATVPTTPDHAAAFVNSDRKGAQGRRSFGEACIKFFCLFCALISIITTVSIVVILIGQSLGFFTKIPLKDFLFGTRWEPMGATELYGVLPLLAGTMFITVGAGLIAVPLGLLSAIFLSEYAPAKLRNVLKPLLEILAGIPTVVYGYFALYFVTPALKHIFPNIQPTNALAGAIVVGIMILPLVSSLCEDALTAVPRALREGAYGLGATKFEVTMKIVVPAALSGIMASFILALSRAIGETMAVTLAAGATPNLTWNPTESIQTMTAYIVNTAKGDLPAGSLKYSTIFAVGVALFFMTLLMNLLAQRLVKKFRKVYA